MRWEYETAEIMNYLFVEAEAGNEKTSTLLSHVTPLWRIIDTSPATISFELNADTISISETSST